MPVYRKSMGSLPMALGVDVVGDGYAFGEDSLRGLSLGMVYDGTGEDLENVIQSLYGIAVTTTWDGTSDTEDGSLSGARFFALSKVGNTKKVGYLHGVNYDGTHRGSGDVYEIAGGYGGASVRNGASGAIGNMFGLEGYVFIEGDASVAVDEAIGVIADVERYGLATLRTVKQMWTPAMPANIATESAYGYWAGRITGDTADYYAFYYNGAAGRRWYVRPNGSMLSESTVTGKDVVVTDGASTIIILPNADPHVAGAWWDNAGVLTKSAG